MGTSHLVFVIETFICFGCHIQAITILSSLFLQVNLHVHENETESVHRGKEEENLNGRTLRERVQTYGMARSSALADSIYKNKRSYIIKSFSRRNISVSTYTEREAILMAAIEICLIFFYLYFNHVTVFIGLLGVGNYTVILR